MAEARNMVDEQQEITLSFFSCILSCVISANAMRLLNTGSVNDTIFGIKRGQLPLISNLNAFSKR